MVSHNLKQFIKMQLKQWDTLQIMRTPLNTEYRSLTVYFNIHASMFSQFKAYRPKFTNKLFHQQSYHIRKYVTKKHTEQSTALYPNHRQKV